MLLVLCSIASLNVFRFWILALAGIGYTSLLIVTVCGFYGWLGLDYFGFSLDLNFVEFAVIVVLDCVWFCISLLPFCLSLVICGCLLGWC